MVGEAAAAVQDLAAKMQGGGNGTVAIVQGRYHVFPNKPLPELNSPTAQAFAAEDRRDGERGLFALVCRPDLPPRSNVMRSLKGVQVPGLLQLVEWGPAYWAPLNRRCMVLIYDRPAGGRVMSSLTAEMKRYEDWEVSKKLVAPLANALRELSARGVTHRAIRPTNMFYMASGHEGIVLGDCVSAPPAFDQPAMFETIENGMTHFAARGSGHYSEDMYSLGVSLLLLLVGRNPVTQQDDASILANKIAQGSYAALIADERLPIGSIEVLRGLLCDDPDERWTIETLDLWLQGRRLSPIQAKLPKRTQRSFHFNHKEYNSARDIGVALSRHWDEAIPVVLGGQLELWLRRALEDKEKADAVSNAVRNVTGALTDKKAGADLMLARVCMILDADAPLRYKGLHVMPDGIGPLLALQLAEGRDTRLIVEAILRDVPKLWLESRERYSPENSILEQNFRELRDFLKAGNMGNGLERCLYELNETLAIQSPILADQYVVDIQELLPALNEVSKKVDPKVLPYDRHIVAFLVTHLNYDVSKQLAAINSSEAAMMTLGMLNLFAILQWRLGPNELLGLTSWVGGLLGPVVTSYHNRDRRKVLDREIPRLVRGGSMLELYKFVDNQEERQKDFDGFAWAQAEWAAAEQEVEELESAKDSRDEAAIRFGQQSAAVTSVLITLLTLTILTITHIW
jgi:hypothetical protein